VTDFDKIFQLHHCENKLLFDEMMLMMMMMMPILYYTNIII